MITSAQRGKFWQHYVFLIKNNVNYKPFQNKMIIRIITCNDNISKQAILVPSHPVNIILRKNVNAKFYSFCDERRILLVLVQNLLTA